MPNAEVHRWAEDLAVDQIFENGRNMAVIDSVKTGPAHDRRFEDVETPFVGLQTEFTAEDHAATDITASHRKLLVAAKGALVFREGMNIKDGGVRYTIAKILNQVMPGELRILWKLQVSV